MAKKALFISVQDLKRKSIIDGNLDEDKVIAYIEVSQDTHIQNYLGGLLYEKLQSIIIDGTINDVGNAKYKLLIDDYIKPMLIWFTQSNYIPFAMYSISNGGITKHKGENVETIALNEMNSLMAKVTETAEFYTRRYLEYMCANSTLYTEYNSNTTGKMNPDKTVNFMGWVL